MKLFKTKLENANFLTDYLVAQFQPTKRTIIIENRWIGRGMKIELQLQLPTHEFWFPQYISGGKLQIFEKFSVRFFCRKDNHLYVPPLPNIIAKYNGYLSGSFCLGHGDFTDEPKSAIIKTVEEFWFSTFRGNIYCQINENLEYLRCFQNWIKTSKDDICDFSNFYSYMESPELIEYEIPS